MGDGASKSMRGVPVELRLHSNVVPEPNTGCWLWLGSVDRDGYGWIRFRGRNDKTHRVSWVLANGRDIPDGLCVCHSCDQPSCVNPAHLWLGTNQENTRDRNAKRRDASGPRNGAYTKPERRPSGERNGRRLHPERYPMGAEHHGAILSEIAVVEIRRAFAAGSSRKILASHFGVSPYTIWDIVKRRSWGHVP